MMLLLLAADQMEFKGAVQSWEAGPRQHREEYPVLSEKCPTAR